MAPRIAAVFLSFSLWLWAAFSSWSWLTVPIFALMLALLLPVLREFAVSPKVGGARALGEWTFGLYAGWTSVAVFANLASILAAQGLPLRGPAGTAWQIMALAGAAAVSLRGISLSRASVPYVLACLWALVGVALATYRNEAPMLFGTTVIGIVAILAAAFRRRRTLPTSGDQSHEIDDGTTLCSPSP